MCKPGGGANRCFIHKLGTKATILMAMFTTNAPERIITDTAKELKKEGRKLPTPAQEEVRAFTMSQAFAAKHGMGIPDNQRDRIAQQWHSAADEAPDGGTLHAWRNTTVRSVMRWKRTITASAVGGALIVTSACGSTPPSNTAEATNSPSVSISAPASPSESVTSSPVATESPSVSPSATGGDVYKDTVSSLNKSGMKVTNNLVETKYGKYPQTELTMDSNILKGQNIKSIDPPAGWTKDDVAKGAVFGANSVFNMSVDHRFNSDEKVTPAMFQQWHKQNAHLMTKSLNSEYTSGSVDANSLVTHAPWVNEKVFVESGFNYVYDGKTPRVRSTHFKLGSESQPFAGGVYYQVEGPVEWNTRTKDGTEIIMKTNVSMGVTVLKENGEFKVAGFNGVKIHAPGPEMQRIASQF